MNITNADYFTFNVDNSMFIAGQTGSGKSHLVYKLINAVQAGQSPDDVKFALFDLKQVEFADTNKDYLCYPVVTDPDVGLDKLDELANLSLERPENETKLPFIFVYIEECDMAAIDQERFDKAVATINHNAAAANMKLIYSTSRPAPNVVSKNLLSSFDLILVGQLASKADADHLGIPYVEHNEPYNFLVIEHDDIYDANGDHYEMMDISKIDTSFGGDHEPHDDRLSELLSSAYSGAINCRRAIVPMELIVPFSDFKPEPNESYTNQFTKAYQEQSPPDLYVYENDGKFIMSDDYSAYYMYKSIGAREAVCTVIGDSAVHDNVTYGPTFKLKLPTLSAQAE